MVLNFTANVNLMRNLKALPSIGLVPLIWLLFSLLFVAICEAQSLETTVGVDVGDWAEYGDIVVEFDSSDPNAKKSDEVIELENTAGYEIEVVDVWYTQISYSQTVAFKDGTQNTTNLQVELTSGLGNGTFAFIPAGLNEGEAVYPSPIEGALVQVNETITRVYDGTARVVNHVNLTVSQLVSEDPLQSLYASIGYYWDQKTGILTERNGVYVNHTGLYATSWKRSDKIKDTNLWEKSDGSSNDGAGGFPYGLLGVVAVAATLTVVVMFRRRKKKLKPRTSRMRR